MDLVSRDLAHIWHPCSQMRDYEDFPPLEIVGAEGSHLHLADGRKLVDATSSWWCKALGHGHPRLRAALERQAARFEHVMGANTAQAPLVELSEKLAALCPPLDKVFYGGDGSTAVEIALKLALQAQAVLGRPERHRFIALENGYHGESGLALAVGDLGLYRKPFASVLPEPHLLRQLPHVASNEDPLWNDIGKQWPALEAQLNGFAESSAALILEPVLQGAGGMRVYSPDLLRRLRAWTQKHGVYLIADEIMTGFWRTGEMLAVRHAGIAPDLLCLSKALTGGWLPFSAVLIHPDLYRLFYGTYGQGRDFLHSNTFSGNALGAALACEAVDIYSAPDFSGQVADLSRRLARLWGEVGVATQAFSHPRRLGAMVAADLRLPPELQGERVGFQVFQAAVARGVLLRNLGNTLYWLPPLNTPVDALEFLAENTAGALQAVRTRLGF